MSRIVCADTVLTTSLIVNGHAGNAGPVHQRLDGYREKLGINIAFHSYWEAYTGELVKEQMESGVCPGTCSGV